MIAEEVPMISTALHANCIAGGVDLFGEGSSSTLRWILGRFTDPLITSGCLSKSFIISGFAVVVSVLIGISGKYIIL